MKKEKYQPALAVVGAVTIAYLGLRAVAVALDPQVHAAVNTAGKAVLEAAKRARTTV